MLSRLLLVAVFLPPAVFGHQESKLKLIRQPSEIMARYRKALELGSMLHAGVSWRGDRIAVNYKAQK